MLWKEVGTRAAAQVSSVLSSDCRGIFGCVYDCVTHPEMANDFILK